MTEKGLELVELVVRSASEKKARDIIAMDMEGISLLADYFVVMHGNSDRQVGAIKRGILDAASEAGVTINSVEGKEENEWLLIDLGDVIVHVFQSEVRSFYNLEKLWSDAPTVDISQWITEE